MAKEKKEWNVQLLAVNPKYKNRTYFLCPRFNSKTKKYDIGFEDKGPAYVGKMKAALGVSKDPDKGLQIDELMVPINHRQSLDLNTEADMAIFGLCLVSDAVARSSKQVDKDRHLFFINDVETEAQVDLSREHLIFSAKSKIFEEGDEAKVKSLCIFLGGIDVRRVSSAVLKAKALSQCDIRPKSVIEFYEGGHQSAERTMVLELYHYDIIQMKEGKYMDGNIFIGTIEEAVQFIANPQNSENVNSLGKRLLEKKG